MDFFFEVSLSKFKDISTQRKMEIFLILEPYDIRFVWNMSEGKNVDGNIGLLKFIFHIFRFGNDIEGTQVLGIYFWEYQV